MIATIVDIDLCSMRCHALRPSESTTRCPIMPDSDAPTDPPDHSLLGRAIWDATHTAVIVTSREFAIRHINGCAARTLGWSGQGRLGELIAPEDVHRLERAVESGSLEVGPHPLRSRPSGSEGPHDRFDALLVSAVSGSGSDDGDDVLIFVGRDAGPELVREARIRRAARWEVVGQVAKAIGHDMNNALGAITTLADLVLADVEPGSELERDISDIKEAAWDAADLTRKLHLFAGRSMAQVAEGATEVGDVLAGIEPLLRRFLSGGRSVHITVDPGCPPVTIPSNTLAEIIMALAANCRDAMPDDGTLRINARPHRQDAAEATGVLLEVEDDGAVEWAGPMDALMEPFLSTKGLSHGTGLGLSTVHASVTESGGAVELERSETRGMRVRLILPSRQATPESR